MSTAGGKKSIEDIIRADGRYPPEAFEFLLKEGLAHAVREVYDSPGRQGGEGSHGAPIGQAKRSAIPDGPARHVTGRQLCLALRDEAIEKWGMLAAVVLAKWNIRSTLDFGNMVYLLIEHGMMQKTEEDSVEDFRDVFDFAEAFGAAPEFRFKE